MARSGTTIGTVIRWDDDAGVGLVEAPGLPEGCWVDASVVRHSTGAGVLRPGQVVEVTWRDTTGDTPDDPAGAPLRDGGGGVRAVAVRPREDLQTGIGG
jgi:cold shock CspA family protein